MVKKGFSFYILYDLKIWQNFEIKIYLSSGREIPISRQILLRHLKVICPWFKQIQKQQARQAMHKRKKEKVTKKDGEVNQYSKQTHRKAGLHKL